MLKSLTVKCYKAFGKGKQRQTSILVGAAGKQTPLREPTLDDYEGETLEIRPITVLLGANSVGKTSLLDLLLALQQTNVYAAESSSSALKLNGRLVSLGEPGLLFHRGNMTEPMEIAFELDNSRRFGAYGEDFRKVLTETVQRIESLLRLAGKAFEGISPPDPGASSKGVLGGLRSVHLTLLENDPELFRLLALNDQYSELLGRDHALSELLVKSELTPGRRRPLYAAPDLLNSLKLIDALHNAAANPTTTIRLLLTCEQSILSIKKCSILVGERNVISFGYGNKPGVPGNKCLVNLSSDLFDSSDLSSYETSLGKMLRPDKPLFRLATSPDQERPGIYFTELCWQIVRSTLSELAESFSLEALAHIDADRGAPRRYYFSDFANEETGQKTGFVSVLAEDENVRKAVSDWMERFSLKLEVRQLADTVHRLLVEERGLSLGLDITDVGYGISQVLPIIVKGLCAPPDSLTFIEQPEAHLHPKMQSELADLFLEMAGLASNRRNREPIKPPGGTIKRRFIIETHSEYLLKSSGCGLHRDWFSRMMWRSIFYLGLTRERLCFAGRRSQATATSSGQQSFMRPT